MGGLDIINLYNRLAVVVSGPRARLAPLSKLEPATQLAAWLDGFHLTPGPYLCACFARHHWARCPALGSLRRKDYATYYAAHTDDAYRWWSALKLQIAATEEQSVSTVGTDIVRKRLLATGGAELCLASPLTKSQRGSPICAACIHLNRCGGLNGGGRV